MKLGDIYARAIQTGMANDPRGRETVERELARAAKRFEKLDEKEKPFADPESLTNPYADSRLLNGDPDTEVRTILAGVDIEVAELLLAERLNEKGRPVDLVLGHHPRGVARARLFEVMNIQVDILADLGVPIHVAEDLMGERVSEVRKKLSPFNHTRDVDAARLLGIPLMCLHTAADNMVNAFLQRVFDEKQPFDLNEIVDLLLEQPEYREGKKNGMGPAILLGSGDRRAGKIFVDMTGGASGSSDIFPSLVNSGVSSIVCMHMSEDHMKKAKESHMNVVIAGHIPSDVLGMNLLLDAVLEDNVEVIECSGFGRVKR